MLNKRGVTLVELLVVMSMFIVISLLIFPLFIQTLRLQEEMTIDMQTQQSRQRWQYFSRDFQKALRGFSDPEIEIIENRLVISEEESSITVEWFPETSSIQLVISPVFYIFPQTRNFRFSDQAQTSWEYRENLLTLTLQKGEIYEHFQVLF